MYIVKIRNGNITRIIHDELNKLSEGKIVKGINTIDSFSFEINKANPGYDKLEELKTLISVFNTKTEKYEFWGRVLTKTSEMEDSGRLFKEVIAENFLGFFTDSVQEYVIEKNWTPAELLGHIINVHNQQVEPYKKFTVGTVDILEDNIFIGIQRDDSWKTIQEKLIEKLNAEIRFRRVDDINYIDLVQQIGTKKSTTIEIGKNMKQITCEHDPTEYVSRLIPLGAKLKDENNKETEERLNIARINNGKMYIESPTAIEKFGIRYKVVCFDDVHESDILKKKGEKYLEENNKVKVKYSITALDLYLLGIDIDSIEVGNIHPIINPLLGIDDEARVIKKSIDILDDTKKSIEFGEQFKSLSDLMNDDRKESAHTSDRVEKIESDYVVNEELQNLEKEFSSSILQKAEEIITKVARENLTKEDAEELIKERVSTSLTQTENTFTMKFDKLKQSVDINGSYVEESSKYIDFTDGKIVIGNSDTKLRAVFTNESVEFMFGDVSVAKFTTEGLDARNAKLENQVQFFNQWAIRKGARKEKGNNLNIVFIV